MLIGNEKKNIFPTATCIAYINSSFLKFTPGIPLIIKNEERFAQYSEKCLNPSVISILHTPINVLCCMLFKPLLHSVLNVY